MEDSTFYIKICPKCGQNLQISLGEAVKMSSVKCHKCGFKIDLKADKAKIEQIWKNLSDIEKDIKRYYT